MERSSAIESSLSARRGINPWGNKRPLYSVGLNDLGKGLVAFRSNVSVWLGAPCIMMTTAFLAVFLVVTAALATLSRAPPRINRYPPTEDAIWRKNILRPSCGFSQYGAPVTPLQSNPKYSFIRCPLTPSVAVQ